MRGMESIKSNNYRLLFLRMSLGEQPKPRVVK